MQYVLYLSLLTLAFCRKRKIKCDGTAPCAGCTKFGRPNECSILYEEASSQGRSYVSYLEDRIKKLERSDGLQQPVQFTPNNLQYVAYSTPSQFDDIDMSGQPSIDPSLSQTQEELPRSIPENLSANTDKALAELKTLNASSPAVLTNGATRPYAATTWSFRQAIMSFAGFQDETGPLHTLPSKDIIQPLVQHFLRHIHPGFPFIQAIDIDRSLEKFMAGHASVNEQVLILMVMAIASSHISKNPDSIASYNAMKLFSTAAQMAYYDPDSIEGLKMNLLMVQFASLNPSKLNTWYLSGITMRACASLGLHKDPSDAEMTESRDSHSRDGSSHASPAIASPTGDILRQDEPVRPKKELQDYRKRLFWAAYIYDRMLSISTGRPCGFDDVSISVGLPTGLTCAIDSEPVIVNRQGLRAKIMQSKIYNILHLAHTDTSMEQAMRKEVQRFAAELKDWESQNEGMSSKARTKLDNEALYTKMLLYRPCAALPNRSLEELSILTSSSVDYITLNTDFLHDQEITYFSHFKIAHLYTAALAVMYACTHSEEQLKQASDTMTNVEIALNKVAIALNALTHRWQVGFDLSRRFTTLHETYMRWTRNKHITIPSEILQFREHKLGRLQGLTPGDSPDWTGLMKRLLLNAEAPPTPTAQSTSASDQPLPAAPAERSGSSGQMHDPTATAFGDSKQGPYSSMQPYRPQAFSGPSAYVQQDYNSIPTSSSQNYNNYLPHQPTLNPKPQPKRRQKKTSFPQPHQPALTPLQQLAATATEHSSNGRY